MTLRAIPPAALAAVSIIALAGCSTHSSAPDPTTIGTGDRAAVIKEPNGFRNIAFSCFGTNGVYVTSAGADDSLPSSVYVVPLDVNCK